MRRSDPLGRIYGWIPSGDLLGSVTRVPYLEELYIERNTEKLNLARIALKRLQTPWKQKLYTQQEKVSRFYYFSPYFELFRRIDVFPIQTLIITPLRNVMLTVTRELGLPVVQVSNNQFINAVLRASLSLTVVSPSKGKAKKKKLIHISY